MAPTSCAPGRTRTGTTRVEGFSYHFGFRRRSNCPKGRSIVRGLDFALTRAAVLHRAGTEGPRRQVSARSPMRLGASLSVASPQGRGFAEFDGIHHGTFVPGCSIFKSLASTCFATGASADCGMKDLTGRGWPGAEIYQEYCSACIDLRRYSAYSRNFGRGVEQSGSSSGS